MPAFRVNAFGDRWLLVTPGDARFYATPQMTPATLRDVMAFMFAADVMALDDFLGVRNDRLTLRYIVEDRPRLKLDPPKEPPPPPYEPTPDDDPILDDPRALRILRCDPRLGDQPLRFTFKARYMQDRDLDTGDAGRVDRKTAEMIKRAVAACARGPI